jgi:hypothetical protein
MSAPYTPPLLNGRAYDWASIRLQLLALTITGVLAISYEDAQEKVNNPGAGIYASSRGYGKYEAKASITLEMKEVERIEGSLPPGKRLQDIGPFNITIAFVNESNIMVTHTLHNCEFLGNKRDMKTGDTNIEVALDLIVSHITW